MREIIINGQAAPIHFGLKAIDQFTKQRGSDFGENVTTSDAVGNIDSIVTLTATGLNEGARRTGTDRRYTEDDVWDIFDDEPHLILEVSQIFIDSIVPMTDKLGDMSKNGQAAAKKK